jgi:saccharopine dehydrogenase-like NADP-dependent oxidoreductase
MSAKRDRPTFVVLGGAGAMGRITVRDLFETAPAAARILVADRDREGARALAASFGDRRRLRAVGVDVANRAQAIRALRGATIVINSVQYQLNLEVMDLALALGAHYVDLGGLFHITRRQLALHDRFVAAGLTAVLGAGAAPGITNVLAWHAAAPLDRVEEIHTLVAGTDRTRYRFLPALPVSYSLKTILAEFSRPPAVFTRGRFAFVAPMAGRIRHRFPAPVGWREPMCTLHSEVATLPLSFRDRGVREVTFRIAFDPTFVDRVRFLRDLGLASEVPVAVGEGRVSPIDLVSHVAMSQRSPEPAGPLRQTEVVRAVVVGTRRGERVTRIADCTTHGHWGFGVDVDTGCPPAIVAALIAAGAISEPGVWAPERAIAVEPFFRALERRQMTIRARTLRGTPFAFTRPRPVTWDLSHPR